jgi:xylose dehydrogenase (NAD/NADP)
MEEGGVSMNKLRWGILGCANIAVKAVIPAIQQSELGVVAAIASRDIAKAEQIAKELQIPAFYGSYQELLADSNIDAVYIPLPNHLHREWTIKAARAGKHVLCEKPASMSERHTVQMVEACEMLKVQFAEAFMYRYHPRYERIREIIRSGEIGDVRALHGVFTFNNADAAGNVRLNKAMGGGGILDVGCYPISAARYLLDQEPEAVTVHAFISPEHDEVDMMASGLVEFAGGVGLTFQCGMWADFRNTMDIHGTKGRIHIPAAFLTPMPGSESFTVHAGKETRVEEPVHVNAYVLQVDAFARSILHGEPLAFSPWDSVYNVRVLEACLLSAAQRTRIVLETHEHVTA